MAKRTRSHRKILGIIAAIIIIILAVVMFARLHRHAGKNETTRLGYVIPDPKAVKIDGVVLSKPRVISDFELTSDQGSMFTQNSLKGHWSLVFFGFTSCGYVCPTTLSALNQTYAQLKTQLPATSLPQVVMISVDPERDSVAHLHDYLAGFNAGFIGVRGSLQQTQALAKQMSVVFAKVKAKNSDSYNISHSAEIMLLDPNGNLRAFFSYPHEVKQMVHDYLAVVHAANA